MLAQLADIVFLVDESASGGAEFLWIADIVNGTGGLCIKGDIPRLFGTAFALAYSDLR